MFLNQNIITLIIILFILSFIIITISYSEFFTYEPVIYRRTPYTKSQYDIVSKIDPSFGWHMWQFQSPPRFDPKVLDKIKWKPGSFGKLVSYLQDDSVKPYIKNLNV
jgi:hypothetical protein